MRSKSIVIKGIAATGAVLVLASCASEPQLPQPQAHQQNSQILVQKTFADIAQEASEDLTAADAARDPKQLSDRFENPFMEQRSASYALAKIMGGAYQLPVVEIDPEGKVLSSGSGFPRTAVTLASPTKSSNLRQLSVWSQDGARSQYKLWAHVPLFSDASAPALQDALSNDAGYTAAQKDSYAVDPSSLGKAYAHYQQTRKQSSVAFSADDPLYTQLGTFVKSLSDTVSEFGEVSAAFTAPDGDYRVVSTDDDGLLVVTHLDYAVTVKKTNADATITLGGEIGALASGKADGALEVGDKPAVAHYSTVVAFYNPPADADDRTVKVLGASVPTLYKVEK